MLLSQLLKRKVEKDFEIKTFSKNCNDVDVDVYFCLARDEKIAKERTMVAIKNGAKIVVGQFESGVENYICVVDARKTFAEACAIFYDNPSQRLKIVGITGTNGKTTTSHIIAEILKRNGRNVGVVGTNGVFYGGKKFDCPLTTPDADFLNKTFADMLKVGVEYVVMEVSAHAIDQERIWGIKFEVAILTNITQDHLDYFGDMERYAETKFKFLSSTYAKRAVACVDDEKIKNNLSKIDIPICTYGIENPCDSFAIDLMCDLNGSFFVANINDNVFEIKTNLVGKHNIYNSLAALSTCKILGLSNQELFDGINFVCPVEGRFNIIKVGETYVVVDYAHTPDGLKNVLQATRDLTDKNVFVVFGCGGDRDAKKRSIMGEIAEKYADYVCITNDNPRSEDPQKIASEIEKNMKKPHFVELDRASAIRKMLFLSKEGDIVLIAGKGAEKYQEIGNEKRPYSDFEVLADFLRDKNIEKGGDKNAY